MDIREKLLKTVDANDPQFKILLHNAIQAEIKYLEEQLAAKKSLNERKRLELSNLLERRKTLKKSIQEKSELLPIMEKASKCLQEYSHKLLEELTLTQSMVDDDSLRQLAHIEQEKKLLEKLEKKCIEYEAEFEKAPLAQELKEVNQELLKVQVELEFRKMNIKNLKDSYKTYEDIQKKREQEQVIAIAKLWLRHRNHIREWKNLRDERAKLNTIMSQQKKEIQCLIKEKEDIDRQHLMARFQMPPPVMDTKFVETIFSQIMITEQQKPDSLIDSLSDSASICSLAFDEMCNVPEKTNVTVTQVEEIEIEPDVISLATNENSQCSTVLESERSLQSPAKISKKSYDCRIKLINENINFKKTEVSKENEKSPRVNTTLKRNRNDVLIPENMPKNDKNNKQFSDNLGAVKKASRVTPTSKRNRNEDLISKNMPRNDKSTEQFSENLGTPKKVKATVHNEERNFYSTSTEIEILDIFQEDSVTKETDLPFENHSALETDLSFSLADSNIPQKISESVRSFSLADSNIPQKDGEIECNSDLSLQSFVDDQHNSVVFTTDEMSNTDNDVALAEQNSPPPEPAASPSFGFFGNQKKRAFTFQGLFK
ncbi:uncharacterized protein LOC127290434 isoform X2 [Leptopilina boulardi]|uniref:uncharacterized protein LOC127290434 isoform X2 n=1 Tax=Leptopilina boulardi TaxID=63433 RepID=UPI0021F50EB3|nr:uncharacterized protein LOC127290434 isoform X2 [Leptopilina boulardi]